ncbi:MAG TPA: chemotaxis protein CheW [Acidimicrobiales bacterium]
MPTPPKAGDQVLVLRVADDSFALPLWRVREVVAGPHITRLPTVPSPVVGMFNLRGELVPAFDPSPLLDTPRQLPDPTRPPFVVVVDTEEGPAGLVAETLPSVAVLGRELTAIDAPHALAVHAIRQSAVAVIDPGALLSGIAGPTTAAATLSPHRSPGP